MNTNRQHDRKYFYKYVTAETCKIILSTNTLRWSSPILFNDPFDVVRIIKADFQSIELQKEIINLAFTICDNGVEKIQYSGSIFKALCDQLTTLSIDERERCKNELLYNIKPKGFSELESVANMQSIWNEQIKKSRIFSMSEDNNNDTMWAHYGDNHKGAMIELECLDLYDSPLLIAQKVIYSDENIPLGNIDIWRDIVTGKKEYNYDLLFKPLELIKKQNWSYEKEWRILSVDLKSDDLYETVHVNPLTFSKVTLGYNIQKEDRIDILKLACDRSYKIEVQESIINQCSRKIEYRDIDFG